MMGEKQCHQFDTDELGHGSFNKVTNTEYAWAPLSLIERIAS